MKLSEKITTIILASRSPARKALLEQQGLNVIVRPTGASEPRNGKTPAETVTAIAKGKLDCYLKTDASPDHTVLCCDTLIAFKDTLLGKAKSREEAKSMLLALSGNHHRVVSGWALYHNREIYTGEDEATIYFRNLTEEEIDSYLDTGEWEGAAGAYRIQDRGRTLVERIDGDFDTVVGLPIFQLFDIL